MTELLQEFNLMALKNIFVKQTHEIGEWIGFETRNKYQIQDEQGRTIGFAAEQQKGIFGFLLRQFVGHWRTFEIHIFNDVRQKLWVAKHPFRFFFQRLELNDASGKFLGAIQRRFAILSKRFDVEDAQGRVILKVRSPIWKIWTFPFLRDGREVAVIRKKWSGILSEALTDRDNFMIEFKDDKLNQNERSLMLAASLFIDLLYFERKASN